MRRRLVRLFTDISAARAHKHGEKSLEQSHVLIKALENFIVPIIQDHSPERSEIGCNCF